METELVDNIANEAICQLQFYENFYIAHKKINNLLLIPFSTTNIGLIAIHVYWLLKFEQICS